MPKADATSWSSEAIVEALAASMAAPRAAAAAGGTVSAHRVDRVAAKVWSVWWGRGDRERASSRARVAVVVKSSAAAARRLCEDDLAITTLRRFAVGRLRIGCDRWRLQIWFVTSRRSMLDSTCSPNLCKADDRYHTRL